MNGQGTLEELGALDSSRILAEPVRTTMLSCPGAEVVEPASACRKRITRPT